MKNKNSIFFLHLSDIHINNNSDIKNSLIKKIVDTFNCYHEIEVNHIIIIISGDITYSGEKSQFETAYIFMGILIKTLKNRFKNCRIDKLIVPGNHDVEHKNDCLSVELLKNNDYSKIEHNENTKLNFFYEFANKNNCFNGNIYYDIKYINAHGLKIKVNLINNAIYSTLNEYKGLLYIPENEILKMAQSNNADFVLTVMHHTPEYYRDNIKNVLMEQIINKSSMFCYGHEHHEERFNLIGNNSNVYIQKCGALCNKGDWTNSSFTLGVLDTLTGIYKSSIFQLNATHDVVQYERKNSESTHQFQLNKYDNEPYLLKISEELNEIIYTEDFLKDYFIFPSIILTKNNAKDTKEIQNFQMLIDEILKCDKSIINADTSVGKTTLLKKIYLELCSKYFVLFCSIEQLRNTSNSKKRQLNKLIKEIFQFNYGKNESDWETFEQLSKKDRILIFDDFDDIDGIDKNQFISYLYEYFGKVIFSSNHKINFETKSILMEEDTAIAKFEIEYLYGIKRKNLIRKIIEKKASNKSELEIERTVTQINDIVKSQDRIIPPEPYYITIITENYLNNIGEAINTPVNMFSKIFESNITSQIHNALKYLNLEGYITVELMYTLIGKIAYYIHFKKKYPISRKDIDDIIEQYKKDYGKNIVTERILKVMKKSKILYCIKGNEELFRFTNKSVLSYFIAKEIIIKYNETRDKTDLNDIINKSCVNICTDILMFIIYQTNDTSILLNILSFIEHIIKNDANWTEFDIANNKLSFLTNFNYNEVFPRNVSKEKRILEKNEDFIEKEICNEFEVKDIYDWDDNIIDEFNNKLIRMTSLLHILSKSLPCFEDKLKKETKKKLVEYLYRLPNMIFMFWANNVENEYQDIIKDLKLTPYWSNLYSKNIHKEKIDIRLYHTFSLYALNLLSSLYYMTAFNCTYKNTYEYINDKSLFDYTQSINYQLQHLMMLERIIDNGTEFASNCINLNKTLTTNDISRVILLKIVKHGIITRNDSIKISDKLGSIFFQNKKYYLIEQTKYKSAL